MRFFCICVTRLRLVLSKYTRTMKCAVSELIIQIILFKFKFLKVTILLQLNAEENNIPE